LHAWAVYAVVALSLAYFHYRRGLPLSVRSVLFPLIGKRIYGGWGHTVDILAVFGTMFGVVTSLGLGVMQLET
ncbi:BCCT family transporter, partial [Stenotrophomonas maltophilia]